MPTIDRGDPRTAPTEPTPRLRMRGVRKAFGGVRVLKDVDLDVYAGEVHALMGENGAGKSTLMKILSGVYHADAGSVEIDGRPVEIAGPLDAQRAGIAIIHQELSTVPTMTVEQNLALGKEPLTRFRLLDRQHLRADAQAKLARVGSTIHPGRRIGTLSVAHQQMIEIARALAEDARILVLDEPTASLSETETTRLFELIDEMRAQGIALVYISHRMEEVYRLADRITVLRDGAVVDSRLRADSSPEWVVSSMVGRAMEAIYVHDEHPVGEVALEVRGLGDGAGTGPVDLEVRAGEVVALAGLVGAGRTELARLIFGADRARTGSIRVAGRTVVVTDPIQAIRAGIGMLPESRKEQALFLDMAIRDNTAITGLDRWSRWGIVDRRRVRDVVQAQSDALSLRSAGPHQHVRGLSGGNQQKVVLGRWLAMAPRVLILDEPTRGVDVGAKHEIYKIINELALQGVAILMVSSELPEVLGVSDRILVMRGGRVVAELDRDDADEETIMLSATGVAAAPTTTAPARPA